MSNFNTNAELKIRELTERINALEHRNRNSRWTVAGILSSGAIAWLVFQLGAGGAVGAAGKVMPRTIEATSVVIVDENGTKKAVLGLNDKGEPSLALFNAQSNKVVNLSVEDKVASMTLASGNGENKATLWANANGAELGAMTSENHFSKLYCYKAGELGVWACDRKTIRSAKLEVSPDTQEISVVGQDRQMTFGIKQSRAIMAMTKLPAGSDGLPIGIAFFQESSAGRGDIWLCDKDGQPRWRSGQ